MYLIADNESSQTNEEGELGPTVIFCNPNNRYYEYALNNQDNWIEFYKSNGINILLWNYRGYGQSRGYPTPKNIV